MDSQTSFLSLLHFQYQHKCLASVNLWRLTEKKKTSLQIVLCVMTSCISGLLNENLKTLG